MSEVSSDHKYEPVFITIDAGTVTASYTEGESGRRYNDHEIGTFRFYVAAVEANGGRLTVWSGSDYEDAMRAAERARVDFEVDEPVHDNVAGGGR